MVYFLFLCLSYHSLLRGSSSSSSLGHCDSLGSLSGVDKFFQVYRGVHTPASKPGRGGRVVDTYFKMQ